MPKKTNVYFRHEWARQKMRISGFFHKTKNAKINVGLFSALCGIIFAVFPTCFTMAATTATTSESITITGTVVDSETQEPIDYATVFATNDKDLYIFTDTDGTFTLKGPNISEIEIEFMTHKTKTIQIENTSNNIVSLGIIEMEPDVEILENATVTGEQSCDPKDLEKLHAKGGYFSHKEKKCVPTACESERYKLTGTDPNTKCLDLNNTDCKETINDKNIKTAKYKWENNQLICRVTNCNDKYIPNDAKNGCILGEGDCTQEQIQSIPNATAGQLKKGVCYPTECAAGYEPDGEKCIEISGDCDPMPEHALRAHREYNSTMGTEVCIIDECSDEYTPSNDKLSCIKPTLTEEQSQARIDELQQNADAMREREQSLANRMIGGASMGAMGIGGMQVASALAEQSADDAAELDMTAYLATFRCDYGAGQNIRGGETNITLPGANILLPLYNEYTTLAADLKSRKESLGMAPGIESETILDATLYDNESIGITDGAYTSLSRALSNPTGADAAEWAAQRAETAEQLKTGAIVAGVGAAVGIAGNILTNYVGDQPRERSAEINAKYDALMELHDNTVALPANVPTTCPNNATGTYPNCQCTDNNHVYNGNLNQCDKCPGNKIPDENGTQCICPSGTFPDNDDNDTCKKLPTGVSPKCNPTDKSHMHINLLTGECSCLDGFQPNDKNNLTKCICPVGYKIKENKCIEDTTPVVQPSTEITIPAENLFELDSAELTDAAKNELEKFVRKFQTEIGKTSEYCITIIGHTDKSGDHLNINQPLSEKRANAVKTALKSAGLEPANMRASGVGSTECETTNPKGVDSACRKVEISATNSSCTDND